MGTSGYIDLKKNVIHICELYKHFELIETLYYGVPEINEKLMYLEGIESDCSNMQEKEGSHNAEWHIYEIARDEAEWKINDILIKKNILRFNNNGNVLYLDTQRDVFYGNNQLEKIKKVLLDNDCRELQYSKVSIHFNDTYKDIVYSIKDLFG